MTPEDTGSIVPQNDRNEHVPERIGLYRILSILGEGGMGTVYLAEQKDPVRRRVALKVIKLGMDSKQVLHRFEAERQALAMMEHSNIAKVFEAGTTERGQPYFVMEHVHGISITDHCDQHKVSIEERIKIFRQVCSGVQHAHQKGVMHRDLKPSNVLVSVQEGEAVPKIIDFGLARATDHHLIQATLFTEQGLIVGTPEYMSPEQAGLGGQDVDTRTDVYSLGVLLYELLVGQLPFTREELRQAGQMEMQRKIKEDEPPKPSTRLSAEGEGGEHTARSRATDTKSLLRRMRGDLDWVVMKAIDKDRTRRYETASALADDLKRHLRHEPVLAGAPSAVYRLKKLARRHRGQVIAATMVLLTLIGGIIGTSIGFAKARDNEILATERATSLDLALGDAESQRVRAETEASRAREAEQEATTRAASLEQVVSFQEEKLGDVDAQKMGADMRDGVIAEIHGAMERLVIDTNNAEQLQIVIDDVLKSMNFTNLALDTLETNILARALAGIDEKFADQPLVIARLLQAKARTLYKLGLLTSATDPQKRALQIRRRELGDDAPDTLVSMNRMAVLLHAQGNLRDAEFYYRDTLERRRRVLGDDNPETLLSINSMGALLWAQGLYAEAIACHEEALAGQRRVLGNDHPETLTSINNMGVLLWTMGSLTEAEPYYREALEGRRRVHGDDHAKTLTSINNMGMLLWDQGKAAEAWPYFVEALEGWRRVLGDKHPDTLLSINSMGTVLMSQGRLVDAELYLREAFEGRRDLLGDGHVHVEASLHLLIDLLELKGDYVAVDELKFRNDSTDKVEAHRARVSAIDLGDLEAESSSEWVHVAYHLSNHGRLVSAYLTFCEAFDAGGMLLQKKHRYNAARAAVRAGLGKGTDSEDLSITETRRIAREGRELFLDELAYWHELIAEGEVGTAMQMATWSTLDPDLACVRDATALSKLDEGEAEAWRLFWIEVEALLASKR